MATTMVITLTKDDTGAVSASVDSPALTVGSAPADLVAEQVARIIAENLK